MKTNFSPDGLAHPTAAEFRTAARVIRWMCREAQKEQAKYPIWKRCWYGLMGTDANEMLRKSALLDEAADLVDGAPNADISDAKCAQ